MDNKKEIIQIINDRITHHSLHNEYGKEVRIDELNILKGIVKDKI
ncbi:MAG: hypothetical protein AABY22_09080 [Nanoarchaeota archaeon]